MNKSITSLPYKPSYIEVSNVQSIARQKQHESAVDPVPQRSLTRSQSFTDVLSAKRIPSLSSIMAEYNIDTPNLASLVKKKT